MVTSFVNIAKHLSSGDGTFNACHHYLRHVALISKRRYCGRRRLSACVCVSVCVRLFAAATAGASPSAIPRMQARRISLRGEGPALYPCSAL